MKETDVMGLPDTRTHATKVREGKRKKGPHPQFVGWRGDDFVFHSESGYQAKLTGPRAGTIKSLRSMLPHWYTIAVEHKQAAFAEAIHREADNLGIVIYAVRERDVADHRFEVVDGPSVHAKVVGSFETEAEALTDVKRRNEASALTARKGDTRKVL